MRKIATSVVAVLLLGGGVLTYQLTIARHRAPSFREGGKFLVPGKDGVPFPYGNAEDIVTTTTQVLSLGKTPTTTVAKPSATTVTTTSGTTTAASTPVIPRNGAYSYAVEGNEGASGFGSRDLPKTASLVVHDNEGKPTSRVFDLRLSGDHEEREIISFDNNGVAFTYEGGSITFGPGTQTSQGYYNPPMVQIPWPLTVGNKVTKTSPVKTPGGDVPRTEKWTTTIIGKETINVLGAPHETFVVEIQRNTTPGTSEQVDRYRKYWYDPELGIWVKWIERFKAKREGFVTFGYKADYVATLTGFVPA